MSAHDSVTLNFYANEAQAYAARARDKSVHLDAFLARLKSGASVLELGCGGGQDSEIMIARGFDVTPTDGTDALAKEAEKRLGRPVQILLFNALTATEVYHGVWANACLLHAPRNDLPDIVRRIHQALKPGGVFYSSFKAGQGEGRDTFGRYYNYPSAEWLEDLFQSLPWKAVDIEQDVGSGYDQLPTSWIHVTATKPL